MEPLAALGWRGEVGLAVVGTEVATVRRQPGAVRLLLGHGVEHPGATGGSEQGAGPAAVLDCVLARGPALALADVVDQLDGGSAVLRDAVPSLGHDVDGGVVVLGDAVRADERVDHHHVDPVVEDGAGQALHNRLGDLGALPGRAGDDDAGGPAGVEEQAPLDLGGLDPEVQADRGDPALNLLQRVLQVQVPAPERASGPTRRARACRSPWR